MKDVDESQSNKVVIAKNDEDIEIDKTFVKGWA